MPESCAQVLLKDKQLKVGLPSLEKLEEHYDGALLEVLVCVFPCGVFGELNSRLEGVSPLIAAPAKQLMNLIILAESSVSIKP